MITYGYDSDVPDSQYLTQRTLHHHAKHLSQSLGVLRAQTGARTRPLIFVAHTLGGILVKNALIFAHEAVEQSSRELSLYTCGVVFLGTPHRGTRDCTLPQTIRKVAETSGAKDRVLRDLEDNAVFLEMQLDQYKAVVADFPSYSFYETVPTGQHIVSPHMQNRKEHN